MKVFIDTEFTSLVAPHPISVGLVAADGRECYVELGVRPPTRSAFVAEQAMPRMGLNPCTVDTKEGLGRAVGEWLLALGQHSIDVVYEYNADFELLEGALRCARLWARLADTIVAHKAGYSAGQPISDDAMGLSWTTSMRTDGIARHHALAAARALRAGYQAVHNTGAQLSQGRPRPI